MNFLIIAAALLKKNHIYLVQNIGVL